MKKKFLVTFLFLCTGLNSAIAYELPSENSDTLKERGRNDYGGLFLIGWSKSGRIAYLEDDSNSGVGVATSIYIMNLKNDAIEYSRHSEGDSMPAFWINNSEEIEINLRKAGIIQQEYFEIHSFPFDYEGAEISAEILDGVSLVLKSSIKGIKEIHHMPDRREVMNYKYEVIEDHTPKIEGYLRSPYEARIAIILERRVEGFEGDYTVEHRLCGADLTTRFSKQK